MRFLAAYIMRGRMQAITLASSLALLSLILPPVSILSSASVALVTLRKGTYEGLLVLLSSCAAAAVLGMLLLSSYQFALVYGLALWLPIWLISIVLREGRHLSLAMEIAVVFGILSVIGVYIYFGEPALMWKETLVQIMQPMLTAPDARVEDVKQSIILSSHFMTGVVAAGSVAGLLFGLLLARWWQAALYNPGGFRQEFLALKSQQIMAIASVITIVIALMAGGLFSEVAWNILILIFVLYAFVGVAVMHSVLLVTKVKRFLLPLFYAVIFLIPHALILVAILGLCDTWLNIRSKIPNQSSAKST